MYFIPAAGRHESPNRHDDKRLAEIEASILSRVYRRPASVIAVGSRGEKRLRVPRGRLARRNGAEPTDAALVRGMLALDNSAWMAFQRKYDVLITSAITKSHVGRLSSTAVADAKAEFYASLLANDLHKLRQFDPERGTRLSTWVHTVAGNAARDRRRYEKRRPAVSLEGGRSGDDDEGTSYGDRAEDRTPSAFDRLATAREYKQAMAALTPDEREIASLRYEDGLSSREVAERLGMKPAAVDTIVFRLRKKLAAL